MKLTETVCSNVYLDGLEQYHVEQESLLRLCCEQDEHLLFSTRTLVQDTIRVTYAGNRLILNELIC